MVPIPPPPKSIPKYKYFPLNIGYQVFSFNLWESMKNINGVMKLVSWEIKAQLVQTSQTNMGAGMLVAICCCWSE